MKKVNLLIPLLFTAITLSACGGISQTDYDAVSSEAAQYSQEAVALHDEKSKLESEYALIKNEYASIKNEYDTYKESMQVYEGLALAEAEAKKIEAESIATAESIAQESIAASKSAEESAAAAEALAQKEAEERIGYETGITFDQLARTPDDYMGKKVKFSGKVIQVLEGDGSVQVRLAVNSDYDNIIYCEYSSSIVSSRVLEDDKITIYGLSVGLLSYKSTMGGTITIPSILVEKIER